MRLQYEHSFPFHDLNPPKPPAPILPVRLTGRHGKHADTYALLDSGADGSLFHANWARRIGLDLYSGRLGTLEGIKPGEFMDCYIHRIHLTIGSVNVRCDVGFCETMGLDIGEQLIGREVVFNTMRFGLRQRVRKVYVGRIPYPAHAIHPLYAT